MLRLRFVILTSSWWRPLLVLQYWFGLITSSSSNTWSTITTPNLNISFQLLVCWRWYCQIFDPVSGHWPWANDVPDDDVIGGVTTFIVVDDILWFVLTSPPPPPLLTLMPLFCIDVVDDDGMVVGDVPLDGLSGDFGLLIREKNFAIAFFDLTVDACWWWLRLHADVAGNIL